MNKYLSLLIGLSIIMLSIFSARPVLAQYQSQGTANLVLSVDKKVKWVEKNQTFDNIASSQHVFVSGEQIEFTIAVKNTGSDVMSNVEVTDFLPTYLVLINYPGNLDKSLNKLTWSIPVLNNGEEKDFSIRATISDLTNVSISSPFKQVNRVEAKSQSAFDSDTASYFIGKKVMPVTGDNTLGLKVAVIGSLLAAAYISRKLIRGY